MPDGIRLIVDVPDEQTAQQIKSDFETEGWTAVFARQDSGKFAVAAAKSPPLPSSG